jgi:hypothetical protein
MSNRVWICPVNDGEAVEIRNLLEDAGEKVIVTRQPWGATWQALEADVVSAIETTLANQSDTEVIGIELGGPTRWNGRNVDHHCYKDDDRSNPKSSLEQVADELGIQLSRYQRLVAENDKGYIPAMEVFGATAGEIEVIRQQDRCAQNVTPDDEAQAVEDIENAEWRGRKVLIRCPKGSTSAHTDRLYGRYDECLTVSPTKWIYFGRKARALDALSLPEHHWCGGRPENRYFGIIAPGEESQKTILQKFWEG